MSSGTAIIEDALREIAAHSSASPADPESITLGMRVLNSMLSLWLSRNIQLGVTPLSVPGDELNEPPDVRNGIVSNLAIYLAPNFDNGQVVVSGDLRTRAHLDFIQIKALYQRLTIPKKVVSSTLPVGAGNQRGFNRRAFFPEGSTIDN